MEHYILFGAGERLNNVLKFMELLDDADVLEIWDNDARKTGTPVEFLGQSYYVQKPHRLVSRENQNPAEPRTEEPRLTNYGAIPDSVETMPDSAEMCLEEQDGAWQVLVLPNGYYEEIRDQLIRECGIPAERIHPHWYVFHTVKGQIVERYKSAGSAADESMRSILDYLGTHDLDVWNGQMKYNSNELRSRISCDLDDACGLYYTDWHGHRMYLKRSLNTPNKVRNYLESIVVEQLPSSPHCYRQPGYEFEGGTLADAGAAEGFFALDCIEKADRVILLEADPEWVEALQHTFEPYRDKTVILGRFLGDHDGEDTVLLNTLIQTYGVSYLKCDIEGMENSVIESLDISVVESASELTLLIAAYHNVNGAEQLAGRLLQMGFEARYSRGYMFFPYLYDLQPVLRRGLVCARYIRRRRVYLWGAGKYAQDVYRCLDPEKASVEGILDAKHQEDAGEEWNNGVSYCTWKQVLADDFDHIVVTLRVNTESVRDQARRLGLEEGKMVFFWTQDVSKYGIFDREKAELFKQKEAYHSVKLAADNARFEYGEAGRFPVILPAEKLLQRALEERISMCRFGDGEFELILNRERPWFQKPDRRLGLRLNEVLQSDEQGIAVCVADDFGNLDRYTEAAAKGIREFLAGGTRELVMPLFSKSRKYYDAYVTRPYMIYRDKNHAAKIFEGFRRIFRGRDILIVEGRNNWSGMNNDLLTGAHSVRRIKAPAKDAFERYDEILDAVGQAAGHDNLVLCSLGPTATVLCYDLTRVYGVQALDIGQLDNEYDWYRMHAQTRQPIPGKCVAELSWGHSSAVPPAADAAAQVIQVI